MSNLEKNPAETICGEPQIPGEQLGNRTAETTAIIEVLEPRDVPLGGIRAMTVRRTLPQRGRSLIGAWCFLDHYGPDDVAATGGMNVPAHPHTGLQTVSWLFSGTIEHRDSGGAHAMVRPGELNLMTAGSGISHSERSTPDTALLHGAQLWVALPEHSLGLAKRFDHYAPPLISGDGWEARVFLGSLLGEISPVDTSTELVGAEIAIGPNAALDLTVDPAHEHGVLVDQGDVGLSRAGSSEPATLLASDRLGFSPVGAASLRIVAGPTGARVLLIGGEPLGEQIVMWWNFIGRSHDDIVAAREEWQRTIETDSSDGADTAASTAYVAPGRFGLPSDEPDPPLPAPALPITRLKPRA